MSLNTEPNAAVNAVVSMTYLPSRLMAIGAPCGFTLFAPNDLVALFLQSSQVPEDLNPWVGIVLLYSISFFMMSCFDRIWIKSPFSKKNLSDNQDLNELHI